MNRLDKAKEFIKEHYDLAKFGLFFSRNTVGDYTKTIYDEDNITIDICYKWEYFEVFGLSKEEEIELSRFYNDLEREQE